MKTETVWMIIGIIICILVVFFPLVHLVKRRWKKEAPLPIDEMEGTEFEKFCAGLLEKKGFIDVNVTKASGDFGVDILAEKDGVTYAIQCKRYADPVGVKAIQEVYAGREYYDRMVGAVLTNQYFTAPAVEAAKKLKILLWDRGYLESMIEEDETCNQSLR
ncbi:MAG: restriction endonuclease [Lachnospiraceae bacterium]|nr:restriction endonuclease [Lachnospiraceae bacterium]